MCGRYCLSVERTELEAAFGVPAPDDHHPRFNIAPSQHAPILRQGTSTLEMSNMRWGFARQSAQQDRSKLLINARCETVTELPSFAPSMDKHRCLVPATGYYEWVDRGARRQPILFRPQHGSLLLFAGLWRQDPTDPEAEFTILTTEANPRVAAFHHRMPLMVTRQQQTSWLDPAVEGEELVQELIAASAAAELSSQAVSLFVNKASHEGPECWHQDPQSSLF